MFEAARVGVIHPREDVLIGASQLEIFQLLCGRQFEAGRRVGDEKEHRRYNPCYYNHLHHSPQSEHLLVASPGGFLYQFSLVPQANMCLG